MLPPPALALSALAPALAPPAAIDRAASLGFRAVALDAASPGTRPRDLDRSSRRGLAAHLRRSELALAGLDLFLPPAHFADAAHVDRALSATLAALDLLADLAPLTPARRILSTNYAPQTHAEALRTIAARAHALGLTIADHAWPARDLSPELASVQVGIDPGEVAAAGEPLEPAILRCAGRIASARWRPVPGAPDPGAYTLPLVAAGFRSHVVIDLRAIPDPARAARAALAQWMSVPPA